MGLDEIPWAVSFGGRAGAFLGNPNFLGGHLALLFPLSLALALDQRQRSRARLHQALAWAVVVVLGAGLLLAQTRGAWLGAAVGGALVLGLAAWHLGGLLRRNRAPLLALAGLDAVLSLAAFFALRPGAWSRLSGTFRAQDHELSERFFLMTKAAQLASLRPLWGVGPGNIRIQFPRVEVTGLAPAFYNTQPYIVGEHAHNDFLQMAAEGGIPAALLWALLMGLWLWHLYGALKEPGLAREPGQGRLLALGVLGGLSALLVHGLANFPFLIIPTQAAAWALAGIPGLARHGAAVGPSPAAPIWWKRSRASRALHRQPRPRPSSGALGPLPAWSWASAFASLRCSSTGAAWSKTGFVSGSARESSACNTLTSQRLLLLRALAFDGREDRLWDLHGQAEAGHEMIWNKHRQLAPGP